MFASVLRSLCTANLVVFSIELTRDQIQSNKTRNSLSDKGGKVFRGYENVAGFGGILTSEGVEAGFRLLLSIVVADSCLTTGGLLPRSPLEGIAKAEIRVAGQHLLAKGWKRQKFDLLGNKSFEELPIPSTG